MQNMNVCVVNLRSIASLISLNARMRQRQLWVICNKRKSGAYDVRTGLVLASQQR